MRAAIGVMLFVSGGGLFILGMTFWFGNPTNWPSTITGLSAGAGLGLIYISAFVLVALIK